MIEHSSACFRILPVVIAAATLLGCSVIAPPPVMARHDGPRPNQPGDVRVQVMFAVAGGVFVDPGIGGEVRVRGQVNEGVAVGGGLGLGANMQEHFKDDTGHPEWLYTVRGLGKFNPGNDDWLAVDGGAGLVFSDTGMVVATFDTGLQLGFEGDFNPDEPNVRGMVYGGPVFALSIPLAPGQRVLTVRVGHVQDQRAPNTEAVEPTGDEIDITFFMGTTLGFGLESKDPENVGGTIEGMFLWAFSRSDVAFLMSGGAGLGATAPGD